MMYAAQFLSLFLERLFNMSVNQRYLYLNKSVQFVLKTEKNMFAKSRENILSQLGKMNHLFAPRKNGEKRIACISLRKKLIFSYFICFFTFPVYGKDLLDIYRLALTNDPTFESARYALKAELEKYPQALAGFLPTLTLNGDSNKTYAKTRFSNSSEETRDISAWQWSLQLTQPLIRLRNIYAFKEAKILLKQAHAQFNLAEQDMILRITRAYFGVLSGQEELNVMEAALASATERLRQAEKEFDKGIVAITDIVEIRSRRELAYSQVVKAKSDLDSRKAELERIIDRPIEQLAALASTAVIPPPEPSGQQYWIARARIENPAVRVAEYGLYVAEANVKKNRSEHLPTLDFVASYRDYNSTGNTTLRDDYASNGQNAFFGIEFSMPIFSGGATHSHVKEAVASKYRMGAELEVTRRRAATDARLAIAGVTNGLSQISALESALASVQTMVNERHTGYRLGMYNNFRVLDAEQKFYEVKSELIKARYETVLQALTLKAVAGMLTEADLVNTNSLLRDND